MRYLLLTLLFMGCDYAPTEHSHETDSTICFSASLNDNYIDPFIGNITCYDNLSDVECSTKGSYLDSSSEYDSCQELCWAFEGIYYCWVDGELFNIPSP